MGGLPFSDEKLEEERLCGSGGEGERGEELGGQEGGETTVEMSDK